MLFQYSFSYLWNIIMLTIRQAKEVILNHTTLCDSVTIDIERALNKILSSDIFSPIDLPPFPQSSMDGYAFKYSSLSIHQSLEVIHKIAAGDQSSYEVSEGEAVRIFTGAPIPAGADTVVMQEKTGIKDGRLHVLDPNLIEGANYRNKGSEIKAGTIALRKGTPVTPATIGFLASMGIQQIEAYRDPTVCILVTGDELSPLGQTLPFGKVYDSNSFTLSSAFRQAGIHTITVKHIPDQIEILTQTLGDAIKDFDIIVLTGGVSVGDFDFVTKAAEGAGVHTVFHKIKQKPGKPMYCGTYENKFVFGLPGNPASALTCFYEYIEPAIKKMVGTTSAIQIITAPITEMYKKPSGLTHFLKAKFDGTLATPLDAQESFRLKSFAIANALIVIAEETTQVNKGDLVEVHLLP